MTSTTDEFPSKDLQQGTEPTKASRRPQQLILEKGHYAVDKVPRNIQEMIERMQKSPRALVASMIFMIEETNLLASVLNLSRGGGCCCYIR